MNEGGSAVTASREQADFIFWEWDRRARVDASMCSALYSDDAVLESPLVPIILPNMHGVLRGKAEIERFFAEGIRRRSNAPVRWHRSDRYLTRFDLGSLSARGHR